MANPYLSYIQEQFWPRAAGREVWMIVDGARDRRVFGTLLDSYLNYSCLYHGELAPELEIAAPYLVQLEYDDRYSRQLIERAWGQSWGVFLKCNGSMESIRRHLRKFLSVRDPKGEIMLFRYYDPRVLRVYLPTCRTDELQTVFGPIDCFWIEDENPEIMLEFRLDREKLLRKELPLFPPDASSTVPASSIDAHPA